MTIINISYRFCHCATTGLLNNSEYHKLWYHNHHHHHQQQQQQQQQQLQPGSLITSQVVTRREWSAYIDAVWLLGRIIRLASHVSLMSATDLNKALKLAWSFCLIWATWHTQNAIYRMHSCLRRFRTADANRILFEPLPELWRRRPGSPFSTWLRNINGDLTSFDMELLDARDAAQNRPFWRMLASYSAMHP